MKSSKNILFSPILKDKKNMTQKYLTNCLSKHIKKKNKIGQIN
jgi:hypothetical protein